MPPESRTLFADTNAFLQVRDLKDIPWQDMFQRVRAVDVMIAPRVIEELDKHKSSTNQRRRDRARAALQLIDRASREPDLAIVVRDQPVRVRIVISSAPRFDWATHPILDSAKPDDQLVAEALSFGNGAAIFSHDSGPRIRARIARLEAFEPAPEWLLPIEQTDEQRKITSLERDLKRALSSSPTIIAGFNDIDEATSEIRAVVPVLEPLGNDKIVRLTQEYLAKHPRAPLRVARGDQFAYQLGGLSDAQVERYDNGYSEFESKVRDYYGNLHERVRSAGAAVAIRYFVENDSGVSAKGLRVEFDLEGNGSLLNNRTDSWNYLELPKPPEKPRSTLDGMTRYSNFAIPNIQKRRDPVRFYWFDRPEIGASHSALQCEEFRATRLYRDTILVIPFDGLPSTLELRLHVSAENLPAPISRSAKVTIVDQAVDWSNNVVREILTGDLG